MSLPETVWCCQTHPHNGHECKGRCLSRRKKCPCELRVADPEDLLIRREDYDAAVERAYQMFRSWLVEDNDAPLRSAVKAALAAAGGRGNVSYWRMNDE